MKKICIYGKGGIGKSTTVSNIAASYSLMGLKVAVIGCDPKADSTRSIMGRKIPTLLENHENKSFINYGYNGILCIEAGGPPPGTGCAGRGIVVALERIREDNLLEGIDVVIYDVIGDVVCGGFSSPLRENIADEVYIVTTSDFMSLYAANNICRGIRKYAETGEVRLAGIIVNGRSSVVNTDMVEDIASRIGTKIIGVLPMSKQITLAEMRKKTVVELYPNEKISQDIKRLADDIYNNTSTCIPVPLLDEELEKICQSHLSI